MSQHTLQQAKQIALQKYGSTNSLEDLLKLARIQFQSNDLKDAISNFSKANTTQKTSENYFYIAASYHQLAKWQDAYDNYQKAYSLNPQLHNALLNSALCLENLKEYDEASQVYQKVLNEGIKNADIYNNLGNLLCKLKSYEEAESFYKIGLSLEPSNFLLQQNFLNLLLDTNRLDDFQNSLVNFQLDKIETAEILHLKAKYHYLLGNMDECLDCSRRSFKIAGTKKYYDKYIYYLITYEKIDSAIEIAKAKYDVQKDLSVTYSLAYTLSYSKNEDELNEAVSLLNQVLKIEPNNILALDCLAKTFLKLGQANSALLTCEKILVLTSDSEFLYSVQSIYTALGKLDKAKEILSNLIKANKPNPLYLRDIGIISIKQSDYIGAETYLSKSVELEPSDQRSVAHLIISKQLLGKSDEAESMLNIDNFLVKTKLDFSQYQDFDVNLRAEILSNPSLAWEPKGLATKNGKMTNNIEVDSYPNLNKFYLTLLKEIDSYFSRANNGKNKSDIFLTPKKYKVHLWAVVLSNKGYVGPHIHENSILSGAYYLKLPEITKSQHNPEKEGYLVFHKPHDELGVNNSNNYHFVKPEEGSLVLFPSYYFHSTIPYNQEHQRISLAFDVEAI